MEMTFKKTKQAQALFTWQELKVGRSRNFPAVTFPQKQLLKMLSDSKNNILIVPFVFIKLGLNVTKYLSEQQQ